MSVTSVPGFALDLLDDFLQVPALGRFAVDLEDDVAGHDAGLVGGGADHGALDEELAGARIVAEPDADAAELAPALLAGTA